MVHSILISLAYITASAQTQGTSTNVLCITSCAQAHAFRLLLTHSIAESACAQTSSLLCGRAVFIGSSSILICVCVCVCVGVIKARFRELCMSVHPDKSTHPDAATAFHLLTKVRLLHKTFNLPSFFVVLNSCNQLQQIYRLPRL